MKPDTRKPNTLPVTRPTPKSKPLTGTFSPNVARLYPKTLSHPMPQPKPAKPEESNAGND